MSNNNKHVLNSFNCICLFLKQQLKNRKRTYVHSVFILRSASALLPLQTIRILYCLRRFVGRISLLAFGIRVCVGVPHAVVHYSMRVCLHFTCGVRQIGLSLSEPKTYLVNAIKGTFIQYARARPSVHTSEAR